MSPVRQIDIGNHGTEAHQCLHQFCGLFGGFFDREGESTLCHSDGFGDPFGLLLFPEIHRGQPELPVLHGLGIFQIPTDGDEFCQMPVADLLALVLEVASGKKTRTEEKGFREISIFKDGVVL